MTGATNERVARQILREHVARVTLKEPLVARTACGAFSGRFPGLRCSAFEGLDGQGDHLGDGQHPDLVPSYGRPVEAEGLG